MNIAAPIIPGTPAFDALVDAIFQKALVAKPKAEVLTPSDLQEEYSIPTSTQAKGRMTGEFIPFFKVGTAIRYRRCDCEKWIADRIQRSTSESA
ncbi:MAG: hypothetical protein HQL53_06040 [Magnetococcales bacterium]|nr:hypothetical protein [Magnetococcales bacterium]